MLLQINELSVPNPDNISFSYKIIGDNLDKVVTPRFMRKKKYKKETMHFLYSYALQDRINTSLKSDKLDHLSSFSRCFSRVPVTITS